MEKQPISREGYDKLREEIRRLEEEEMPIIAQRIADGFPRASVEVLDRQTWYVAHIPEPIPDPPGR